MFSICICMFPSDSPPTPRTVRDKPTLRQSLLTFLISPGRLELSTVIQILKELDNLKKEHIQLIREKSHRFPSDRCKQFTDKQ